MTQPDLFQEAPRGLGIPNTTLKRPEGVGSSQPQAARKALQGESTAEPSPDGRGRRDTSRMAFAEQRASGKLGNNQARIVDLLRANPGRDYTRSEISSATGMPINVVAGRTNELIHVKRFIEEKRKRACSVTGKTVWAVGLR